MNACERNQYGGGDITLPKLVIAIYLLGTV